MDKHAFVCNLKRQSEDVKSETSSQSKKRKNDGAKNKHEVAGQNQQDSKKKVHLSADLFHDHCEISHSQIHELLRFAALGKCASATQPSWCRIHHQKSLSGVVVVVLQDVSRLHYYRFYLQFRFLRRTLRHRFSLPPRCPNVLSSLVGINHSTSRDYGENGIGGECAFDNSDDLQTNPIILKYGNEKRGLTRYLLTREEMINYDYPFPGMPDCVNYVSTEYSNTVSDNSPLFGLDCEMCRTVIGKELTRVSLLNADGHCILDKLVKPRNLILDYLTRFSGITRQMLQPVETRLEEVQFMVKILLPPDAVLVGHSLNNDLNALKMVHPYIIDTSLLYPREHGRFKLKFLAEAILGQQIQCENKDGHDPNDDARATLQLAQYLIHNGPRKVAELNLEELLKLRANTDATANVTKTVVSPPEDTTILAAGNERPSDESEGHSSISNPNNPSFLEMLHSNDQQCIFLSGKEGTKELPISSFIQRFLCSSNEEVLHQARNEVPLSYLSIVQFSLESENIEKGITQYVQAKLQTQLAEMMTVYAGPFKGTFSLQAVNQVFEACGPIRSLSMVTESQQPFVCIQYEVLEAAQLAVEILDATNIGGSLIKVQRPIKETTLDCETIIRELDGDIETENIVYVSGIKKYETEEELKLRFNHFEDLEHIFLPKDTKSGKNRKYCFLKFLNYRSALIALTVLNEQFDGGLKCRKALTPRHLYDWTQRQPLTRTNVNSGLTEWNPGQHIASAEQELAEKVKKLDKTVNRLYKSLPSNTLFLVLLPGINSVHGSCSGFGLMGVTAEDTASRSH